MTPGTADRIALLVSRVRNEENAILSALERRGVPCDRIDPRTLHRRQPGPAVPWRTVLNREISATRALYGALVLEAGGARVVNSSAAIETCADKWRTTAAVGRAGLPTPRTSLALTPQAALAAAEELGYPVVLKPLVGSWGRRIARLGDAETAQALLEYCEALPGPQSQIIYLQEYIDKPGRDIRVIVVGGTPIGAVYRISDQWRTNVARGGSTQPCPLSDDIVKLAAAAATAVGADLAGVDLIEDADGAPMVLEVNHGVEFTGFQAVHRGRVDVAEAVADHLLSLHGGTS